MGVITKTTTFVDGTIPTAAQFNGDFDTIYSEFNGSITNANISASAAISASKIAGVAATLDGNQTFTGINTFTGSVVGIGNVDGWTQVSDSWAYASATTITIPAGGLLKYAVGDRIKLIQSAVQAYFYIVAVADTLLTITGGKDYTLTNNSISSIYFSHEASPNGFPQFFNYTPTFTGFSSDPPTPVAKFSILGKVCFLYIDTTSSGLGTSNTNGFSATLPVASASSASAWGFGQGKDNTSSVAQCNGYIGGTSSTISFGKDFNAPSTSWTTSGGKGCQLNIWYPI
jgi:hypothetical protein